MSRRRTKLILMPDRVIETIAKLRNRIHERFGERGLFRVSGQLLEIAKADIRNAARIGRRYFWLRLLIIMILAAAAAGLWLATPLFTAAKPSDELFARLVGIDAAVHLIVLTGAMVVFLVKVEELLKRRRALVALHELRSIVHVIDMHQLTKDPSKFIVGTSTPSSPPIELNEFEMTRYLEYCSEMLSLTSKVAVVFGQALDDAAVAAVVSDIEHVSAGLSQKIWQKIVILQQLREKEASLG